MSTTKTLSRKDSEQALRSSFNDSDSTLSVNGFLVGVVGRKVEVAVTTTTVPDDTEVFTFSENGNQLYELTLIYTDGSRGQLISAERTA